MSYQEEPDIKFMQDENASLRKARTTFETVDSPLDALLTSFAKIRSNAGKL